MGRDNLCTYVLNLVCILYSQFDPLYCWLARFLFFRENNDRIRTEIQTKKKSKSVMLHVYFPLIGAVK